MRSNHCLIKFIRASRDTFSCFRVACTQNLRTRDWNVLLSLSHRYFASAKRCCGRRYILINNSTIVFTRDDDVIGIHFIICKWLAPTREEIKTQTYRVLYHDWPPEVRRIRTVILTTQYRLSQSYVNDAQTSLLRNRRDQCSSAYCSYYADQARRIDCKNPWWYTHESLSADHSAQWRVFGDSHGCLYFHCSFRKAPIDPVGRIMTRAVNVLNKYYKIRVQ